MLPNHVLISAMVWIITPFSSRSGYLRRWLNRYSAHGFLRDKRAALIETRGGPDTSVRLVNLLIIISV